MLCFCAVALLSIAAPGAPHQNGETLSSRHPEGSHTHRPSQNTEERDNVAASFLQALRALPKSRVALPFEAFGQQFILDLYPKHPFSGSDVVNGTFVAGTVRGFPGSHVRFTAIEAETIGLVDFHAAESGMQRIEIETSRAGVVRMRRKVHKVSEPNPKSGLFGAVSEKQRKRRKISPAQGGGQNGAATAGRAGGHARCANSNSDVAKTSWKELQRLPGSPDQEAPAAARPDRVFSAAKNVCTIFLDVDSSVVNGLGSTAAAEALALHTFAITQDAFERNTNLGVNVVLAGMQVHTTTTFDSAAGTASPSAANANYEAYLNSLGPLSGKRRNICLHHALIWKAGLPTCVGDNLCTCADANENGFFSWGDTTGVANLGGGSTSGYTLQNSNVKISTTCSTVENPSWPDSTQYSLPSWQSGFVANDDANGQSAAVTAVGSWNMKADCAVSSASYSTANSKYTANGAFDTSTTLLHEIGHQLGAGHDCQAGLVCGGDVAALSRHNADCAKSNLDHTVMSYEDSSFNKLKFSECSIKDIKAYLTQWDPQYQQATICFISAAQANAIGTGAPAGSFVDSGNVAAAPAGTCSTLKVGYDDASFFYFYYHTQLNGQAAYKGDATMMFDSKMKYLSRDSARQLWAIGSSLSGTSGDSGCSAAKDDLIVGNDECCSASNQCYHGEGDCDSDAGCQGSGTCGTNNCPWGDDDDCCIAATAPWEGVDVGSNSAVDAPNRVWSPDKSQTNQNRLTVTCAAAVVSSCSADTYGDTQLACGADCTPQCPPGSFCTAVIQYCQADGTCGTSSAVDCTGSAPSTAAAPSPPSASASGNGLKTCSQLGWTNIVNNVCGESDEGMGGCQAASLADARAACNGAGARLCTTEEVNGGATAQTGCGFDTGYTWTDTWCGLGPEGGKFYVAMGGGNNREWKCKNPKKSYNVRCCSDVSLAGATAVAATTTTTFPFLSERKNCATLGWTVVGAACGESDRAFKKGLDKCFTNKNHPDAERKCLKMGGRMCAQADIEAGVGKGTGCNFDTEFLWTSTPCGVNSYIKAKGNGDGGTDCAITKSKGPMRCCSDVTLRAATPHAEAAGGAMAGAYVFHKQGKRAKQPKDASFRAARSDTEVHAEAPSAAGDSKAGKPGVQARTASSDEGGGEASSPKYTVSGRTAVACAALIIAAAVAGFLYEPFIVDSIVNSGNVGEGIINPAYDVVSEALVESSADSGL